MARSVEAQQVLQRFDDELAEVSKATGTHLHWSVAEREILDLIAAHVDRRVELTAKYNDCDQTRVKIALATEIRLTEAGIGRLVKQIDTNVPEEQRPSITSLKAQRAANARWRRERLAAQSS